MKFVIAKTELLDLLGKIQNVVAPNASPAILSNFMLEADDTGLVLTSTDLKIGIRCFSQAKVIETGAITLPAKKFFQLMKEVTSPNIQISAHGLSSVDVEAGSSKFKIHGMDTSTYPELPNLDGAQRFKISQKELKESLFRTAFSTSKEKNRLALTGVLMHVRQGEASFVGTDGKRLSKCVVKIDGDEESDTQSILPIKAVEEMMKNIGDEGEATFCLLEDKVAVETENFSLITKLISGDYPDYNRVIPKDSATSVTLHREEMIALLKQICFFTPKEASSVRFTFSQGELVITGNSGELGEGKVSMPVHYSEGLFEIAFCPHFLLDILRHCSGETVMLELSDSYNPGIIKDSQLENAFFMIMPMRLATP